MRRPAPRRPHAGARAACRRRRQPGPRALGPRAGCRGSRDPRGLCLLGRRNVPSTFPCTLVDMTRARVLAIGTGLALLAPASPAAAAPPPGAATPQAERAVRWALRQVGVRELGTSNCGRMVVRWQRRAGWRVPPCHEWCGAFVHEAWLQAGVNLRSGFLNPEDVLDDAQAGRHGLRAIPVRSVRRGDLVIFRWGDRDTRA